MDSILNYIFWTGFTGSFGYFYVRHIPEEYDENHALRAN
jgi:hypothetical protein